MARERMVTRTVVSYDVECITMDVETIETSIKNFTITGDISDNDKVLKMVKKAYEDITSNEQIVAVRGITEKVELYGMDEVKFIANAVRLDPETRKPLDPK